MQVLNASNSWWSFTRVELTTGFFRTLLSILPVLNNAVVFCLNNVVVFSLNNAVIFSLNNVVVFILNNAVVFCLYNVVIFSLNNAVVFSLNNAVVFILNNDVVFCLNNVVVFSLNNTVGLKFSPFFRCPILPVFWGTVLSTPTATDITVTRRFFSSLEKSKYLSTF